LFLLKTKSGLVHAAQGNAAMGLFFLAHNPLERDYRDVDSASVFDV
jgi:hypothetical protein